MYFAVGSLRAVAVVEIALPRHSHSLGALLRVRLGRGRHVPHVRPVLPLHAHSPSVTQLASYRTLYSYIVTFFDKKHFVDLQKTGNILGEEAWNSVALSLQRATLWESYRTLFWSDFDLSLYEMEDRRLIFNIVERNSELLLFLLYSESWRTISKLSKSKRKISFIFRFCRRIW